MRIALTGGASGIGAETARLLQGAGHHVTAFDIAEPPAHIDHWVHTDMGDPASITAAVAAAEGPFDALISNAGLPPREGQSPLVLNVNFIGLRQFMMGMLDHLAPGASIVNVASRAGAAWAENLAQVKALMALGGADELEGFIAAHNIDYVRAYNLSKEAVIVMSMAQTTQMVARGLRINSVSPAAVSTGILDDFVAAFGEKVAKNIARAGRAGTPEEIAQVIAFMASPASHWMKGVDVVIDGGMGAMSQSDLLGLTGA